MTGREHLPGRRLHENDHSLTYNGIHYHLGIGRAAGSRRILEVFIKPGGSGGKRSGQFERICDDVGLVISYLLRSGTTPAQLAAAVAREGGLPGQADGRPGETVAPSSFIGAIADRLALRQAELEALPVAALLAEIP